MSQITSPKLRKKKCATCKKTKPVSEFYRDLAQKDGLYSGCKKCHGEVVKRWQTKNAESFRKMNQRWKQSHRKRRAEQSRDWARAHPEYRRELGRQWRAAHPDYGKNWRQNNKDKVRNYQATRRARLARNGGEFTIEEWNRIIDFYGHKCLRCGRGDVKLTMDHVLPIFLGGTHTADNIQPLCGPCNSAKRYKHIDYRKELCYEAPRN